MPKSKVFTGVIWASIQRFGTMIISFVTNIVLARLLTPDDFGTIGMLLLFLAIANTFVDSGFGSALIQKKDANQTDFSTVFFINLGLSVVVYAILFFGAPWVARFYDVDILRPLLRAQGLVLILHAFSIIQTALLRKKMDFKNLSICNLIGNIVGSVVGIGAALMGFGVWSLVIRTLVVGFVTSLLLWIIGKWKPFLVFSKQSFKELFGFGGFMLLSSIVFCVSNNVQTLVIGKLFNSSSLGNFTQARQLRNVITDSVSSIIAQVLYPEFANNQTDDILLLNKLHLSISILSFLSVGIMALCIIIAEPLILLLFGEKWVHSILFFQILCIAGCFYALQDVNINIVAAKGKSKLLFIFNTISTIVYLIMIIVGGKLYGMNGLVIASTVYVFIAYLVFTFLSLRILKDNIWNHFKPLLLACFDVVLPIIVVIGVNHHFLMESHRLLIVVLDSFLLLSMYWIIATKTKNTGCLYLNTICKNIFKNKIKNKNEPFE